MILPLAAILLSASVQSPEAPVVTIDRTATVGDHLADLQRVTGARLKSLLDSPGKSVRLQVRDATFFQALDALCRADGSITYFGPAYSGPDGVVQIRPDPWMEYPVSYSGPFRIMVADVMQTSQTSSLGQRRWARVHLVLFAPPWISVGEESGAKADFVLQEARDAAGNDLIPPPQERDPVQRVSVENYEAVGARNPSNSAAKAVPLRSFDVDRGIALLRGQVALTVAEGIEVAIEPKEGASVETPVGTLRVDRVSEHLKAVHGILWRIQLTLKPSAEGRPLRLLLENRVRQGAGEWSALDLPRGGMTFEAVIGPVGQLPGTLVFRARKDLRPMDVPFEFRNVSVKKG